MLGRGEMDDQDEPQAKACAPRRACARPFRQGGLESHSASHRAPSRADYGQKRRKRSNTPSSWARVKGLGTPASAPACSARRARRADPRPATDPAAGARGSDQRSAPAQRSDLHLAPDQRPAYHGHIREFAAAERHRLGHDGAHHRAVHRDAGEYPAAAPHHPVLAVSTHADRHRCQLRKRGGNAG